jgi:hypothetical protein
VRAEQVIESGLGLYSQGDLMGALERWREALEIDPDNRRARQYVAYVEEHYEVLDRKLRGERPAAEEPGTTIEMEADDPMDEIDAYDSVEVSIPDAELPAAEPLDSGAPTEEMSAQQIAREVERSAADPDDERTGEATKAEGLTGLRRAAARRSSGPKPAPRPAPIIDESVDEGWSLDGLEDVIPGREDSDTLEMASNPSFIEDLSDLGTRADTRDPFADDGSDQEDGDQPSAITRPSDDATGEVTRPEGRGRPDSGRQRAAPKSTAPPPSVKSEPKSEFDLADFDDPDSPALGPAGRAPAATRPAADDDVAEVRVTFRSPRDSEVLRTAAPAQDSRPTVRDRPQRPQSSSEEDEATVDRRQSGMPSVSFDDETFERPSLSMLAEAASDLDSVDGAESDDLALDRRPGSEGDTGAGDSSERETTQLYQRAARPSKGAASMELIAAELEADLDEAVSVDPSLGDEAIRARVGWLINRARSENDAGHFPIAVVAIDLALEQHPDSAVAQKLIHSNRDVFYDVYRSFLGNMHAVPSLAMAMDKIPLHELDHRAAFLLSRIDGVLTLEDVLDVSGMARLEAFRHLTRLILRGILELRT